jgi:hypothetical protein
MSDGNKMDVSNKKMQYVSFRELQSQVVKNVQLLFFLFYVLKHCVAYCRNKRDNKVI